MRVVRTLTNEVIFGGFAVSNKTVGIDVSCAGRGVIICAYLALASLTLTRGRARSSLRRWLCSIRRLSLSSDIDWRPPVRELMVCCFGKNGTIPGHGKAQTGSVMIRIYGRLTE